MKVILADGKREYEMISDMRARAAQISDEISVRVNTVLRDVKDNGIDAVNRYSNQFDKTPAYEISGDVIENAYKSCPKDLKKALEKAAHNIQAYHEKMLARSWEWSPSDGIRLGQRVTALERVGVYVPGGKAAYPSSVLMNVIPAKVAGVNEIIMVTPPTENLNNAVLAAAKISKVDRVFAVGGAQAIAALAYGAGIIPRVDKIVGPGNAYVAAAKRLVYGGVDIDMVAGPSEVLIIADSTANPVYVAADLLSQAEHDELASAILITTDNELALKVIDEVEKQSARLSRKQIIEKSIQNFGAVIVAESLEKACEISNEIAPEHLELMIENPEGLLDKVKNAGAIFLGRYSPEPLGDYMAGPCHVLPTSSTARFFSPLSTDSFIKKSSVIRYDEASLNGVANEIILMAEAEGLTAHANSISVRKETKNENS